MSQSLSMVITYTDGTNFTLSTGCISFDFTKEYYTPYTLLHASFYSIYALPSKNPADIKFYIGANLIHHGICDSVKFTKTMGKTIVKVTSKGYSSMLAVNEIEPGMKSQISLNTLMANYITIPNVTHESNDTVQNYIYVTENSSMWDAVAILCYRLNGGYPYIDGTNNVRITAKPSPITISSANKTLLEYGTDNDYTKMVSKYSMADTNGAYSTYISTNSAAASANIVRCKCMALDYQFLYDPTKACPYYLSYSNRGSHSVFMKYNGYSGEDLCDLMTLTDYCTGAKISKIQISGSNGLLTTKLTAYYDSFCN